MLIRHWKLVTWLQFYNEWVSNHETYSIFWGSPSSDRKSQNLPTWPGSVPMAFSFPHVSPISVAISVRGLRRKRGAKLKMIEKRVFFQLKVSSDTHFFLRNPKPNNMALDCTGQTRKCSPLQVLVTSPGESVMGCVAFEVGFMYTTERLLESCTLRCSGKGIGNALRRRIVTGNFQDFGVFRASQIRHKYARDTLWS